MDQDYLRAIEAALSRIQFESNQDNFARFTIDSLPYSIQVISDKACTAGEQDTFFGLATSNDTLPDAFHLTDVQVQGLLALGWNAPSNGHRHFYRSWPARNDSDRQIVARSILRTFVDIYGLSASQHIAITVTIH